MPGLVKVEDDAGAAPAAQADQTQEDEVDYGGDAADAGPPSRAMPDYTDLVDDDVAEACSARQPKEEEAPSGQVRKEAILVSGVARLTRTHLAEVFESKRLPEVQSVEWIADDRATCVFASAKDAADAFTGCQEGFADTSADHARPGPGLWRAQRFMLEFRMATQDDRPASDFKKQHRAGKFVREYRFWESVKDADKRTLGDLDVEMAAPSGEDGLAAAVWDDDRQRRKRLRGGGAADEDDDDQGVDLLSAMAQQDKSILVKEEAGESRALPNVYDEPLAESRFGDEDELWRHRVQELWRPGGRGQKRRNDWEDGDWWGNGGRGSKRQKTWNDRSWDGDRGSWNNPQKRQRTSADGRDGDRRGGQVEGSKGAREGFTLETSAEEEAKRKRRANRFGSNALEAKQEAS